MRDREHDDLMADVYRKDPSRALELLNSLLEDGDPGELMIALRQMLKAFGGESSADEIEQLNRTLSAKGDLEIRRLSAILKTISLRLVVLPIR